MKRMLMLVLVLLLAITTIVSAAPATKPLSAIDTTIKLKYFSDISLFSPGWWGQANMARYCETSSPCNNDLLDKYVIIVSDPVGYPNTTSFDVRVCLDWILPIVCWHKNILVPHLVYAEDVQFPNIIWHDDLREIWIWNGPTYWKLFYMTSFVPTVQNNTSGFQPLGYPPPGGNMLTVPDDDKQPKVTKTPRLSYP